MKADRRAGKYADRQVGGQADRQVPTSPPWAGARLGVGTEQTGLKRSSGRYGRGGRRHGNPCIALSPFTITLSKRADID